MAVTTTRPPDVRRRPPSDGDASPDLAAKAADAVEDVVATVRAKTTEPVLAKVSTAIWGTLLGFLGIAALVLLYVLLLRVLVAYLPGPVWVAHLVLGAAWVLLGTGLILRGRALAGPDSGGAS